MIRVLTCLIASCSGLISAIGIGEPIVIILGVIMSQVSLFGAVVSWIEYSSNK